MAECWNLSSGTVMVLRNISNYQLDYMVSHSRRPYFSFSPPPKPQIPYNRQQVYILVARPQHKLSRTCYMFKLNYMHVTQCTWIYSITFPSLTKRPDFLQSDAYFNHMYMSSWGETTSVCTWMIRCQSSTTRWQPCIQYYTYWYTTFTISNRLHYKDLAY
jgi:hypothetical protein